MSSYTVDLISQEIDYPFPKLKVNFISSRSISDSRTHELSFSVKSELKEFFRYLRARVAIFSDEEILEEIKKWRKEQKDL